MEIPCLRLALTDERFFSDRTHPARRLLTLLVKCGQKDLDSHDRAREEIYSACFNVVLKVLRKYNGERMMLEDAAAGLRAQLNPSPRELPRPDPVATPDSPVARNLSRWLQHDHLPLFLKEFIQGPWKQVLETIMERDNGESVAWQSALKVIDELIWSIEKKSGQAEKLKTIKLIPGILMALEEGLTLICFDHRRKAKLFGCLEAVHMAVLHGRESDVHGTGDSKVNEHFLNADQIDEIVLESEAQEPEPKSEDLIKVA
jgi:hypothetical protein